jgi:hypothetical protein
MRAFRLILLTAIIFIFIGTGEVAGAFDGQAGTIWYGLPLQWLEIDYHVQGEVLDYRVHVLAFLANLVSALALAGLFDLAGCLICRLIVEKRRIK